ncbi:DNA cytosine methyltransferase [Polycladidibacter hongkongensis]|uniref:DNA cytosine methyltransferase n=1 Tax=Polycladidibacter hongkongensis TaxID=1647556 RepID=UPI000836871C|nr:DNA cytosine methyltransferase [Pseudovibrio hongkongensis]
MTTIINTKLGETKGRKRVYLEGRKLAREGIEVGQRYDIEIKKSQAILTLKDTGRYTVSRRQRGGAVLPVIDCTADEIAQIFEGSQCLRILVKTGVIIITAHHQTQRVNERVNRFLEKVAAQKPLDTVSLFHGGGILDAAVHEGLSLVGIPARLAVAVEIEPKYLEASLANNPIWDEYSIAIEGGVEAVNLRKAPLQADLLVAGIPCTGASKSGRTANKLLFAESHDKAGMMFFQTLQFIEAVNPAIVLLENVKEYMNTASMAVIRSVLASLGYRIEERVFCGNEFGALERRERLCVLAVSHGLAAVDLDEVTPMTTKPTALDDVLEQLPEDSSRWKDYRYIALKAERDAAAGKGFKTQLLTGSESHCGTIGRGYNKVRSTEPRIQHPTKPEKSRLLTAREHAKVKSVPQRLIADLPETTAHEILGQAVIYPVFVAIAKHLGQVLALLQDNKPLAQAA